MCQKAEAGASYKYFIFMMAPSDTLPSPVLRCCAASSTVLERVSLSAPASPNLLHNVFLRNEGDSDRTLMDHIRETATPLLSCGSRLLKVINSTLTPWFGNNGHAWNALIILVWFKNGTMEFVWNWTWYIKFPYIVVWESYFPKDSDEVWISLCSLFFFLNCLSSILHPRISVLCCLAANRQ